MKCVDWIMRDKMNRARNCRTGICTTEKCRTKNADQKMEDEFAGLENA